MISIQPELFRYAFIIWFLLNCRRLDSGCSSEAVVPSGVGLTTLLAEGDIVVRFPTRPVYPASFNVYQRWYYSHELLLWIKKYTLTSFVFLGMRSEENTPITNIRFLLHDNAPAHRSVLVKDFLAKSSVTTLDHPPYSHNLAAADFYLFPLLKSALNGQLFCDATDIIKNATEELKRLSHIGFEECFQSLYCRWQKRVVTVLKEM